MSKFFWLIGVLVFLVGATLFVRRQPAVQSTCKKMIDLGRYLNLKNLSPEAAAFLQSNFCAGIRKKCGKDQVFIRMSPNGLLIQVVKVDKHAPGGAIGSYWAQGAGGMWGEVPQSRADKLFAQDGPGADATVWSLASDQIKVTDATAVPQ